MKIDINVPCGQSGDWLIEEFTVSEDESRFSWLRGSRGVAAGTYKRLMRGPTVVMSNTPAEISDHIAFIHKAKHGGNILINGLGLGVALTEILKSEAIETITVIEKSSDVIKLVAGSYTDKRINIVEADAYQYKPAKGLRFNAVWHDIWDYICADNLPEMTKLHRKYGRLTDWQGSWCKGECLAAR